MKKSHVLPLLIVLSIAATSCGPSKIEIATANAQTQMVVDRLKTDTAETQAANTETENAIRTSAASSTFQAATETRAFQDTATRAVEETSAVHSTIAAATAMASSLHQEVKELVNNEILSQANGTYHLLSLDFDSRIGDDELIWAETGFLPTDFVIRFNFACPFKIRDDTSSYGIEFRGKRNGDAYVANLRFGRIDIVRRLEADITRLEKTLDDLTENWKPGDAPVIFDFNPVLGSKDLPEDKQEIRVTLVVEGALFYIFVDSEQLFRAYDMSLETGNLRMYRGSVDSGCNMKNIELWILD